MEQSINIRPELPFSQFQFIYRAITPVTLPAFQGSTWRGLFGHQLKRTVCVTHLSACKECKLFYTCPYAYIFETPVSANAEKMKNYPQAPHPFVFDLPWQGKCHLNPGDELRVGINVIAGAHNYFHYIYHALQSMGRSGVGRGDGQLDCIAVQWLKLPVENNWEPYDFTANNTVLPTIESLYQLMPAKLSPVSIVLETPLRLTANNKLVSVQDFEFHHLFRNLLRRCSMLTFFHTSTPFETDFAGLSQLSREVMISRQQLQWADWQRYSNRQKRPIKMGGLRGTVIIDELPGELWPILWLGQWLHAGKGASMGLGRYRLRPASLPQSRNE